MKNYIIAAVIGSLCFSCEEKHTTINPPAEKDTTIITPAPSSSTTEKKTETKVSPDGTTTEKKETTEKR